MSNLPLLNKPTKNSAWWGVLLFGILVFIDQITKALAVVFLSDKTVPVVKFGDTVLVALQITYNRGISFGIGSDSPTALKIGVVVGTGVIMLALAIGYFVVDKRRTCLRNAFVFIVAGGVGNLIDRVFYRVWDVSTSLGVRDMVDVSFFGFGVCNFADFFITAGAFLLVFALLFFDKEAVHPVGKYKTAFADENSSENGIENDGGQNRNGGQTEKENPNG